MHMFWDTQLSLSNDMLFFNLALKVQIPTMSVSLHVILIACCVIFNYLVSEIIPTYLLYSLHKLVLADKKIESMTAISDRHLFKRSGQMTF